MLTETRQLLLRIYGPQVEYLIDRERELRILRRLARKSIGPRVLGTFANGRFEEFFHARTLCPEDIRHPDTSKHIAKRMRELHDGIELLSEEREGGPAVWDNWDKWLKRTEEVVLWTDRQILSGCRKSKRGTLDAWRSRGLICGVEWPVFRRTVELARKWLIERYGGVENVKQQLVFAHNDVRIRPDIQNTKLTRLPDAIRKHSPSRTIRRIPSTSSRQSTQTPSRHRFRVRRRQHARPGICKPFRKQSFLPQSTNI